MGRTFPQNLVRRLGYEWTAQWPAANDLHTFAAAFGADPTGVGRRSLRIFQTDDTPRGPPPNVTFRAGVCSIASIVLPGTGRLSLAANIHRRTRFRHPLAF